MGIVCSRKVGFFAMNFQYFATSPKQVLDYYSCLESGDSQLRSDWTLAFLLQRSAGEGWVAGDWEKTQFLL